MYWGQQLGLAYGVIALAYLLLMTIALLAADSIALVAVLADDRLIFLVERLVTVWAVGWRGRALAAPLFIELGYALFLQVVLRDLDRADRPPAGRRAGTTSPGRRTRRRCPWLGASLAITYGIVLPASVLLTDWYQALASGWASTRWSSRSSACSSCCRPSVEMHGAAGPAGHSDRRREARGATRPPDPSMDSRIRSAWPLWRGYSSIMARGSSGGCGGGPGPSGRYDGKGTRARRGGRAPRGRSGRRPPPPRRTGPGAPGAVSRCGVPLPVAVGPPVDRRPRLRGRVVGVDLIEPPVLDVREVLEQAAERDRRGLQSLVELGGVEAFGLQPQGVAVVVEEAEAGSRPRRRRGVDQCGSYRRTCSSSTSSARCAAG